MVALITVLYPLLPFLSPNARALAQVQPGSALLQAGLDVLFALSFSALSVSAFRKFFVAPATGTDQFVRDQGVRRFGLTCGIGIPFLLALYEAGLPPWSWNRFVGFIFVLASGFLLCFPTMLWAGVLWGQLMGKVLGREPPPIGGLQLIAVPPPNPRLLLAGPRCRGASAAAGL
jgi:hypothetical protein